MTTDDIVRALEGAPSRVETLENNRIAEALTGNSVSEAAADDAITRALNGQPSVAQEAANRATLHALGGNSETILGEGVAQDDDYLAHLGLDVAKENLRNRLMATNPTLTAGAAELRVEIATETAYTNAKSHRYEADRLAAVTEALKAEGAPQTTTFVRAGGKTTKL